MRILTILAVILFAFSARAMDIERFGAGKTERPVYFVHDAYAPIVSVMAVFDKAGYAYEPEASLGIGALALDILEEGAGRLSPKDFRRFLDGKHASLTLYADADAVYMQVTALSSTLPATLDKIAEIIADPAYDKADFSRYANAQATAIKARKTVPSMVASQKLAEIIYPGHPYSRPALGDGSNLAAYTPALARTFHNAAFVKDRAFFGIAGDISREDAKMLTEKFLQKIGGKSAGDKMALAGALPPAEYAVAHYTREHIEMDVPQSAVAFALPGVTRDDPRFFDYYVANYMLGGGGFESHLMDALREKQGLAYGVSSTLSYRKNGAAIIGGAATSADKLPKFVEGLRKEIAGPKDKEASSEIAGQYLLHSFALSLARNSSVAAMLAGLALYDLPTDYLDYREKAILAAKGDHIAPIFDKEWLDARLAVVTVGRKIADKGE